MKYCIIIPTHNRNSLLNELLSDIAQSSIANDSTIIVVNSGSKQSLERVISRFSNMNICHVPVGSKHYWSKAIRSGMIYSMNLDYDHLIWMNDDIALIQGWAQTLELDLSKIDSKTVLVGTFKDSAGNVSYGLRNKLRFLCPGEKETGTYMNGNLVVFPRTLVLSLGPLPHWLRHSIGDYLYGLKAIKQGNRLVPSSKFLGICERHEGLEIWQDNSYRRIKRIINLFEPIGLDYFRYIRYVFLYDRSGIIRKVFAPFWRVLFR